MPVSVSETINKLSNKVLNAPLVRTISKNPIYTALAITIIIILIIVIIFRDVDQLSIMTWKAGTYIFMSLIVVVFLHDRILIDDMKSYKNKDMIDRVFDRNILDEIDDADVVPVSVNYDTEAMST
jgi:hypothetical protein